MGTTWGENPERGVYKHHATAVSPGTQVLYVDERTGAADLDDRPVTTRRSCSRRCGTTGAGLTSSARAGPGSGLLRHPRRRRPPGPELDQRGTACRSGDLGRMGLAIAPSAIPRIVYALIEAKKQRPPTAPKTAVAEVEQRSTSEAGRRRRDRSTTPTCASTPSGRNRVYNLASVGDRCRTTAASTFSDLDRARSVHPDHHAMWINPDDPAPHHRGQRRRRRHQHAIAARPGGSSTTCRSRSSITWASTWTFHSTCTAACRTTAPGAARRTVWENGGIRNLHWDEVGFGDGFATLADCPTTPRAATR